MKKFLPGIPFVLFLFLPLLSSAATLSIAPPASKLGVGDTFSIVITLDSEGDVLNAIEADLAYPQELLAVKEIESGNSVVLFWIDPPKSSDGIIHFSGITPGGYQGEHREVLGVVFEVRAAGEGEIRLKSGRALLHDGAGTPRELSMQSLSLSLNQEAQGVEATLKSATDTEPPEIFSPTRAADPSIFNGQHFLAFATQDKGSGIDHYEVAETRLWFAYGWERADSPYLLGDQYLTSDVHVKATDAAGNERISVFHRERFVRPYELLIGGMLIVLLAALFVRRLRT